MRSGIDIFQLRFTNGSDREILNTAIALRKMIHKKNKMLIVNNRPDIAFLSKADGVHLGSDDIDTKLAKSLLGPHKIVGRTVHSLSELKGLTLKHVDYLSVGPVFRTKTKPELNPIDTREMDKIIRGAKKPLFAIGGINLKNVPRLVKHNIRNISVCRGIILEKDIKRTVKELKKCLVNHS